MEKRERDMTQNKQREREDLFKKFDIKQLKKKKRNRTRRQAMYFVTIQSTEVIKRIFDFTLTLIFLIIFSPVFIFTGFAIVLENPGPIFYSQTRVGKKGRHFDFYKFRSMVVGADKMKDELLENNESADGVIFKMKDDPRITKTGRFIRRFSIDELPQLINILKGDMSLVGPRPPIPREVDDYSLDDRKRLNVIPGITCIWQVSGRSDIPFDEQVELDSEYIGKHNPSIWDDIKLLLKTIGAVLSGNGAY